MFTGIIEEIGVMKKIARQGHAMVLTIGANLVLEQLRMGDSIAVNGVCLTVVGFDSTSVSMDVMPETYRKTNLANLLSGGRVNLERAMAVGGRYGGHIVQGHVDSTGTIRSRASEENAVVYTIEPARPEIMKYIVGQGSIAIDGISLTVVRVDDLVVSVSIIPHTLAETILVDKYPGDTVNVECDILGKYIERLLHFQAPDAPGKRKNSSLSASFLMENGFM
ncbi:MAG: riboflavin synthase [Gorillibacterium sp.]|nr:riboflavin synthase [Gorillibacterium sp.]